MSRSAKALDAYAAKFCAPTLRAIPVDFLATGAYAEGLKHATRALVREFMRSEDDRNSPRTLTYLLLVHGLGAFAPRLMASISYKIRDGQYRDDLDPGLTMLSMIALTVFPFLAKPVMETVLGREMNEEAAARLVEHNIALFHSGVLHAAANKEGDEHAD